MNVIAEGEADLTGLAAETGSYVRNADKFDPRDISLRADKT